MKTFFTIPSPGEIIELAKDTFIGSIEHMKNFEIRTIEHQGIKVSVQIDYDQRTISLVEKNGENWKAKQYLFKNRQLGYMKGWRDVLSAMEHAITTAEALLTEHVDTQDQKMVEQMIEIVSRDSA